MANVPGLKKGDKILFGKYKNREAVITGFGTDDKNQPTILTDKGELPVYRFRLADLMEEDFTEIKDMKTVSEAKKLLNLLEDEERQTFLPATLIMVDLEMTGVIPERDDILQIAMMKLKLNSDQPDVGFFYEQDGDPLEIFLKSDKTPSNAFHREFLMDIFGKANASDIDAVKAKQMIVDWLGDMKGLLVPCGDAVQCDLAFLYAKGIIDRGDIVNDQNVPGTFNHEVFDLNALKLVSRQKQGQKEDLPMNSAIHNAMVDCQNQTLELNHYIDVLINT